MFPERHERGDVTDDVSGRIDHTLPDTAEVAQVEDVVELGRRRQHLALRAKPKVESETDTESTVTGVRPNILDPFFFIVRARSDPIWPVFSPGASEKERPYLDRPGLANESNKQSIENWLVLALNGARPVWQ